MPSRLQTINDAAPMTELLILPDGRILVHNLTPAMAAILAELNPADEPMRERASRSCRRESAEAAGSETRIQPADLRPQLRLLE